MHDPSFGDPRAPGNHATTLRARAYRAMMDPADADACGKCHAGAPTTPAGVALPAPGATACTTCHTEPGGALACGTCHGAGARAYPPRDPCFFPEEASRGGAHAAHVGPSKAKADGLPCATCHPAPSPGQLGAPHADGYVEVWLDYARAGATARFDDATGTCTTSCHARGGARPSPSWRAPAKADCGSCHRSPPENHYAGACSGCHAELDATGGLVRTALHLNGRVDVGDGSGKCGACHGAGDDPWPRTGAHAAHARPRDARAVPCETCHVVPDGTAPHPRGVGVGVRLTGLAVVNGARASWDPATRSCASTYCHAGRGAGVPSPRWDEGATARACGACHASPPPPPHSQSAGCDASGCHTGYAASAVSPARRDAHVDGFVTR